MFFTVETLVTFYFSVDKWIKMDRWMEKEEQTRNAKLIKSLVDTE